MGKGTFGVLFKLDMKLKKKSKGFTLIEVLIVVAILAILILMALFAYRTQIAKGRDARRKADLDRMQKAFEDYYNDEGCYPSPDEITSGFFICRGDFFTYFSELPCDPQNSSNYNYFYSYPGSENCKSWYKIYTKLENEQDSAITKVGCITGCGPSNNYNYVVTSPNVSQVGQTPEEGWWPTIAYVATPTPTTGAGVPTNTPTPSPTSGPINTPTPTPPCEPNWWACFSPGECRPICGPWVCPNSNYRLEDCDGQCDNPLNWCH